MVKIIAAWFRLLYENSVKRPHDLVCEQWTDKTGSNTAPTLGGVLCTFTGGKKKEKMRRNDKRDSEMSA